jgi:hypothetical protein
VGLRSFGTERRTEQPLAPGGKGEATMLERTSRVRRFVAAITLPFMMSACMSWTYPEPSPLRDTTSREQPETIAEARVRKIDKFETGLAVIGFAGLVGLAIALANYETP